MIFDLDGVLVDSEPAHRAASRRLVAPQEMGDEEYARFVGSATELFAAWIRERYGFDAGVAEIVGRYTALVAEELATRRLAALDGAHALLAALRARGQRLALASQSQPEWVSRTLEHAGLSAAFEVVVAADAVARGKPAPDIYLHTAARLGIAPGRCLVIEDSAPGVAAAAAAAAGMTVVQTRQASTAIELQAGAHVVVETLRAFDFGWLRGAAYF